MPRLNTVPREDTLGNCRNLSTPCSAKAMTPFRTEPPSIHSLFLWSPVCSTLVLMLILAWNFWERVDQSHQRLRVDRMLQRASEFSTMDQSTLPGLVGRETGDGVGRAWVGE